MEHQQEQEKWKEDDEATHETGNELPAIGFLQSPRETNPVMLALRDSMRNT
jgi:hypothetical protein